MCAKPYACNGMEYGCGQCMPCRINRRRLWSTRLVLESFLHRSNLFVTMTYSPEHLPAGGNLVPRHVKLWLMRIRKELGRNVRYFVVGEYGEKSGRPHYHGILFGVSEFEVVQRQWLYGNVFIGSVTAHSAGYVTGYCTKGWTSSERGELAGRVPEFARMSLKPGIGAGAVGELARVQERFVGSDVYATIRVNGKKAPLGRYITNKLRVELGRSEGMPEVLRAAKSLDFLERMKIAGERRTHEDKRLVAKQRAEGMARLITSRKRIGL